jgi:cation:H+ antiporter
MLELGFLILGIIGLILGAQLVVKASTNLAEHYKISPLFLGLTIVTIGTDLPELVVNVTAAIQKLQGVETSGLIVGNIIGSSMGQIGLSLGVVGVVGAISLTKRRLSRDGLMAVISVMLVFLAAIDGVVTRVEGVSLLLIYAFYFLMIYREEKITEKVVRAPKIYPAWVALSMIAGFVMLIFSSDVVVENAVLLASTWGVSQSWIGIVLVGLGTSLPELAIAAGAIRKGQVGLSVGNLVGSNIFDLLFVLGGVAVISEFNVASSMLRFDLPFLFLTSLLVLYFFRTRMKFHKKEAIVLLFMYGFYMGFTIYLGLAVS